LAGPLGQAPENTAPSFAFSPDGELLAVWFGASDAVDILDPDTLEPSGESITNAGFAGGSMTFTPTGDRLIIGGREGVIGIADLRARRLERTLLVGHTGRVMDVLVLADERTLVSASRDETIRLWDIDSRLALGRPVEGRSFGDAFRGFEHAILQATATGALIPTAGGVLVADVTQALDERACVRAGVNLTELGYAQYFGGEAYHVTCPTYPSD
jgi:hypothetical protein